MEQRSATNLVAEMACLDSEPEVNKFEDGQSAPPHANKPDRGSTLLENFRASARFQESFTMKGNRLDSVEDLKTVFVDAAAMKEKVRQNLSKPTVNVHDFYKKSGIWQQIARSSFFGHITLFVIGLNAFWLAVDTDLNNATVLIHAHPIFQTIEHAFCTFFFAEWLVRFMAFRNKRDCVKDTWFIFDSGLVSLMVLETWVMTTMLLILGGSSKSLGNASLMKVARLFRLTRMARMARLLRSIPELMIMVKGIAAACRSVFFTLCLLALLTYIFAIVFKQLTDGTQVGQAYFGTVLRAMYSLLLYGALLDNVGLLSGKLGTESVLFAGLFFIFILCAAYTILNMLVGVLCEVVSAVAATEREEMLVSYVNRKVKAIVDELDKDGDNCISKSEFVKILENWDAVKSLQDVGVDVVGLVDFADVIFEDGAQELTFEKFMDVVLQLRGTNTATVKDIVELRKMVRSNNIQTHQMLARLEGRICSQVAKPGHLTPSISTVSFDSIDLDKLGIKDANEGMGIVMDSFPMPPLSSARAMFIKHDSDADSLPSADSTRDAGHMVHSLPTNSPIKPVVVSTEQGKLDHKHPQSTVVCHGVQKVKPKIATPQPAPEPEVLPQLQGQWVPCRPGEGMHVCKAMLEHISISGRAAISQGSIAMPNWDRTPRFEEHCMSMDFDDQAAQRHPMFPHSFGCSAEFQEFRGLIATLERLLSVNLVENGTILNRETFSQVHADIASSIPSTAPDGLGVGSATPPAQNTTCLPMCDCSSAVDSKVPTEAL